MAKYRARELCVASKWLEKLSCRMRHLQQIQVIKIMTCCAAVHTIALSC